MRRLRKYLAVLIVAAFATATGGCRRSDEGPGPAERAGKKIDETLERLGDETGRLMEQAGEKLQDYGESTKENAARKSEETAPSSRDPRP